MTIDINYKKTKKLRWLHYMRFKIDKKIYNTTKAKLDDGKGY